MKFVTMKLHLFTTNGITLSPDVLGGYTERVGLLLVEESSLVNGQNPVSILGYCF